MSLPKTCPFCSEPKVKTDEDGDIDYRCGSWASTERGSFQSHGCKDAGLARLAARVAELEALATQAGEDEAWANERTVLVEFQPIASGWYASAPDGVVGISATAPTIHGALRALREKMEGGTP